MKFINITKLFQKLWIVKEVFKIGMMNILQMIVQIKFNSEEKRKKIEFLKNMLLNKKNSYK